MLAKEQIEKIAELKAKGYSKRGQAFCFPTCRKSYYALARCLGIILIEKARDGDWDARRMLEALPKNAN